MPKQKTLKEAYSECEANGQFKDQEVVNKEKILSMLNISKANLDAADKLKKDFDSKNPQWCVVYTLYYESLRKLTEAFIMFNNKKVVNHQCLFAYLCEKHPELELDWNFFETVRTKRNGINYYGTIISNQEFKEIELQTQIYIKTLEKATKAKLGK